MEFQTIIGLVASIFTAVSLVPQLCKVVKEKAAQSISLPMLLSLFIGLSCWVYYGFLINDWILILSNAFSLVVNIALTVLSLKYKD
ncbi:MAG TPA: SemiSWEET transporter [Bacteroidia bacterium]|jgi:MtN3 and saliva related transmembrane protein|nr:SemiSWEET transporter [Bacteroidia bacterium]